jgi:hypothetical protein
MNSQHNNYQRPKSLRGFKERIAYLLQKYENNKINTGIIYVRPKQTFLEDYYTSF